MGTLKTPLACDLNRPQSSNARTDILTRFSIRERWRNFVGDTYLIAKTNWLLAPFLVLGWSLLPIHLVACVILRALGIRILTNQRWPQSFHHVGHLAIEFDGFFKDRMLGRHHGFRPIVVFPRDVSANPTLLQLWSTKCLVISHPVMARLLRPLAHQNLCAFSTHVYIATVQWGTEPPDTFYRYSSGPPTLKLTAALEKRGRDFLKKYGVPENAWFVCIHARTAGFYRNQEQDLRNVSIEHFNDAISYVTSQGGWIVRMGDPTMPRLPDMPQVLDYAHNPDRIDALDVFLSARCRAFLGCASGPYSIAATFGVPVAVSNQAGPLINDTLGPNDLYIPKLLVGTLDRRVLPLKSVLAKNLHRARFTHCFDCNNLSVIENSPKDILGLLKDIVSPNHLPKDDRERAALLRERLRALLTSAGLGSRNCENIAPTFLLAHEHELFSDDAIDFTQNQPLCGQMCCPCII
jgi:putative glycosyltransferase (TIGR04372 family)